ncbi:hypothetical protein SRABI84_03374 [Peribacillus simplex]|nr:hypothetical protein SRABI84_03374 [Peribacillus simplex]
MPEREMCTYCGKWFDMVTMTPLYEQHKTHVNYYCERCMPDVRDNLFKLPYRSLFTWGKKGLK